MDQGSSQRILEITWNEMKMKMQHTKICGFQLKLRLERNL